MILPNFCHLLDFCHDHLDRGQPANGVVVDEVVEVAAVEGVSVEVVVVVIEEDSGEDEVAGLIEAVVVVDVVLTEAAAAFEDIGDMLR